LKMSSQIELTPVQIEKIRKLADEKRRSSGIVGDTPIANDIFTVLDKLGIYLLEYPIRSDGAHPAFSATLICSNESEHELAFLGLNTSDYFDRQIFAIAHELYHYFIKTGSHLSRLFEDASTLIEAEANRFAAEFLLPEAELESIVITEFKSKSLAHLEHRVLVRFIARLHCTWWLPYRSIVRRLKEISAISNEQYDALYCINERDPQGEFARICQAINREVFNKLNAITNNVGTSPAHIEIIIRNFEDGMLDEEGFASTLELFGKKPNDFGYDLQVPDEELDDLKTFFTEVDRDEH